MTKTKKNIKTIKLVLTDVGVKMFNTIPTFKNSIHTSQLLNLKNGENIISVNHYTLSHLKRIVGYDEGNMFIIENV